MNTKEYIESGTLELYVSGLLSVEEMHDVELKACQFPEIKTELEALQTSMQQYAMKHAIMPSPSLKNRVMTAIEKKETGSSSNQSKPTAVIREIQKPKENNLRFLVAAAVVMLLVISALTMFFAAESRNYKNQVAELTEQQSTTQKQLDDLKIAMNQDAETMAILTHSATVRVDMKGTEKSPQSSALIFWNKETKTVYLDIKALPPAPVDKQYQLWFINETGPVNAGVFDLKTGELMKMIQAPSAAAFAVTLEPKGGSTNPTMDELYVVGNVPF